jgi:hypothetical protein
MRARSINEILNEKFRAVELEGIWKDAIGSPELLGTWFVYGDTKQGKTTLSMMLAKYLSGFGRVFYNAIEEGVSLSVQNAYKRVGMHEAKGSVALEKETIEEMIKRLQRLKSPNIVFVDSVQFADMKFADYKKIKQMFPSKLFIYISHVNNKKPDGAAARGIWRDASVVFRVEGFKAFPISRFGGDNKEIIINQQLADVYWGMFPDQPMRQK